LFSDFSNHFLIVSKNTAVLRIMYLHQTKTYLLQMVGRLFNLFNAINSQQTTTGIIADNGFAFDRLGVRIPTVLVSPHVSKGVVIGSPTTPTSTSCFDGVSPIATANKLFGVDEYLTNR
jgi:hypothetical protein